ncbi:Glutamyl-tRNA(Gln) amidotransferase subunit E [uncultured archaeon]|nr:Glutamyl-tRNA(Gln) amidotransferase subunit E [uncultured archaeon]
MEIDYAKIGFKSGLEIHQQLDTHKLFCNCPSVLRSDNPDFTIKRKLNVSAGESGKVDTAAAYQASLNKTFVYQGYDSTCLVELDEEPPHQINPDALRIALQISELLHCKVFHTTQIMRKTVVNGSNTSGFQRTVLIAHDGWVETSSGKVGIQTICLEEDAAREVGKEGNTVIYRLDRLGIPLVEIATEPDIKSAEQVKEVALYLGKVLRSCKVKRGLGTIRQDVNVSIKNGARIEIKGFQDPRMMTETVDKEILRQKKLIEIHGLVKGVKDYGLSPIDLTSIFRNTECNLVKNSLVKGGKVFGAKLPGFFGLLGLEFYEGKRFGTELSNYGKAHAGVGGLIHSDEQLKEKYKFSDKEISEIRNSLKVKDKDAFVLVVDEEKKARKAVDVVISRANTQINIAVPSEVRNALPDGSTEFLRPMPGADRMYPETDLPLLKISQDLVNDVKRTLPKLHDEVEADLKNRGLTPEMVKLVLSEDMLEEFESLLRIYDNPNFVVKALILWPKEISSKEKLSDKQRSERLSVDIIESILQKVAEKKISESGVKEVLEKLAKGSSLDESLSVKKEGGDIRKLEERVLKLIKEKPGLNANAYMGLVMAEFKGQFDGKVIMETIRKFVK